MKAITFRIHLNEPAIFAALEGDPNSAVSYKFIPGSAIRGLIISLYLKNPTHDGDFATNADTVRRFLSSETRYLNAYPVINEQRSLPVPATWTEGKYTSQKYLRDSAFAGGMTSDKQKTLKGFVQIKGETALMYSPEVEINVHTQRARRDAGDQQVFRYEAIASGQTFEAVILCANKEDEDFFESLLKDISTVVIGGSRTAGYGKATLSGVKTEDEWQETTHKVSESVVMTFLSDAVFQDDKGMDAPTPQAIKGALAALGITCDVEPLSLKTIWVGGFNRKWGLPLPQHIAIERGSVVRLHNFKPTDAEVQTLTERGIGTFREDGMGRVAIGWQQDTRLSPEKYIPDTSVQDVELSDESKAIWRLLRGRIRDRQLEEKMAGVLYNKPYVIQGNISKTQLSRLRSEISNELRQPNPSREVLSNFLTEISGKNASRQFDAARIDKQSLSDWLQNPVFGELSDNINKRDRYVLQLVDTVLQRAYIQRDKQADGGA